MRIFSTQAKVKNDRRLLMHAFDSHTYRYKSLILDAPLPLEGVNMLLSWFTDDDGGYFEFQSLGEWMGMHD